MRRLVGLALAGSLAVGLTAVPAAAADAGGVVVADTIASFDDSVAPEGIAVGDDGTVYVSTSRGGEIWKLDDDGNPTVLATIDDDVPPAAFGVLGLWIDGDVLYATAVTFDPDTHGVWKVSLDGRAERVPNSEEMTVPNSVVTSGGVLYITDSLTGQVWRSVGEGRAELWQAEPELVGTGETFGPTQPIGANGVAVDDEAGVVIVANTERASIVTVPINADGSAGPPSVVARGELLTQIDGIARTPDGRLFGVANGTNLLVQIAGDGTVATVADETDGLDGPSSVAVGPDGALYVVNLSISERFGLPSGAGPGVVRAVLLGDEAVAYASGSQEVPTVGSDAWAWSVWRIVDDVTRIAHSSTVFDLDTPIVAAHLHWAPRGENGPIVVNLTDDIVDNTRIAGEITADELRDVLAGMTIADLVAEIEAGRIYINIHTDAVPSGEIRGQLLFR